MSPEPIDTVEGDPVRGDPDLQDLVRRRLRRLAAEMQPRLPFLAETADGPAAVNLIGSVALKPGVTLRVRPKTRPGTDWTSATLDLLAQERFSATNHRQAGLAHQRQDLARAMSLLYADRLEEALRLEGPIVTLNTRTNVGPQLTGRLLTSQWVRLATLRPHHFPSRSTRLEVDNFYTAALSFVADQLALAAADVETRSRLRRLAVNVRLGGSTPSNIDSTVARRPLPPQWKRYEPAWSIAQSLLAQAALFRRSGQLHGFDVAVEAWPLLETLLVRALNAAALLAVPQGRTMLVAQKVAHPLLSPSPRSVPSALSRLHSARGVEPDGLLMEAGKPVAVFEAKYSRPSSSENIRQHVFQVLTTAAALEARLAVLVYPEDAPPVRWDISGFGTGPVTLVAIGLDMFEYQRGAGDELRGKRLLSLL